MSIHKTQVDPSPSPQSRPNSDVPNLRPAQQTANSDVGNSSVTVHCDCHHRIMPTPGDRGAPRFDGMPLSLHRFFRHVERVATPCGLNDLEIKEWAFSYLTPMEEDTWRAYADDCESWQAFKDKVTELYPGAGGDKYMRIDLENLVQQQSLKTISARYQLGEYNRNFLCISSHLKRRGKLSPREICFSYMTGFTPEFRWQVQTRLQLLYPLHDRDEPWSQEEIYNAALKLLPCVYDTYIPDQTTVTTTSSTVGSAREVAECLLPSYSSNGEYGYYRNRNEIAAPLRRRHICYFCSDSHEMSTCQVLAEYVRKGLCKRGKRGRIILPDGRFVNDTVAPGINLKDRIDNWHSKTS